MVLQDPMTSLNPLKTIGAQIQEAVELHQGLKGPAAKQAVLVGVLQGYALMQAVEESGRLDEERMERALDAFTGCDEPE